MGWIFFGLLIAIVLILWVCRLSRTEKPKYKIIEKEGKIEIREYGSMVVAQTQVEGERKAAIREGFRRIAAYIFGENSSSEKVAMTAPVLQEGSDQSVITEPGGQEINNVCWTVCFVMPTKFTLRTLPKPKDDRVHLRQLDRRWIATIRFSGETDTANLRSHLALLIAFLQERQVKAQSNPIFAFYNPPWTLPALRRNEIWIEIVQ